MTLRTQTLHQLVSSAFTAHGKEGIALFQEQYREMAAPVPSHIALKFTSQDTYRDYQEAASMMGAMHKTNFKDKEITWCELRTPFQIGDLSVHWLELVEPKEPHDTDGVASIGYVVDGLTDTVKLHSDDGEMLFRYQGAAVHPQPN